MHPIIQVSKLLCFKCTNVDFLIKMREILNQNKINDKVQ